MDGTSGASDPHPDFPMAQSRSNHDLQWLLVFTKPAGEPAAKTNLERQGYEVYFPRLLQPVIFRGRWVERVVPLFPRYVFIHVNTDLQSLATVRSTIGVNSVVRFGLDAAVVPDAVVDSLAGCVDPISGLHRLSHSEPLACGSLVSIMAGTFKGLSGIFERKEGSERVVVLLKLLGQNTPVRVPSRYVVPQRTDTGRLAR